MFNQLPLRPRRALRRLKRIGLLTSPLLTALLVLTYVLIPPAAPASAQTSCPAPSFQGLGPMPGDFGGGTFVNGISGDGATVIGYTWVDGSTTVPFRWTAAGGYEDLGTLGGANSGNGRAYGVSYNGSVIVGYSSRADGTLGAFRWVQGNGMQEVPIVQALATSADGSVIVGMDLRWTASGQIDHLGFLGGNNYTSAAGVSGDGQVVVGYSETSPNRYAHAFRWTLTSGIQDLGVTTGTESNALGISSDGSVIFGEARDAGQFWRAFRWTQATGMRDLGTLGGPMSTSHGASADGSVIVGKSLATSLSSSLRAFRWTQSTGMRDVKQELINAGVTTVQNWTLAVAADISDDGTVIAGWGYPASLTPAQPWIAILPPPGGCGGGTATPTLPSSAGFQSPAANSTDTGGDGNGFESNPSNAHNDDSLNAVDNNSGSGTSTSCTSTSKDKHRFFNYGFSIPSGAAISGIEVRLDARADSSSSSPRMCVQLSWDGGTTWTATKATGTLGTSMATFTLGNTTDAWGRTWGPADFSNTNFRVRVINVSSSTSRDFFLDWISVRVTYSGGGATSAPPSPTLTSVPPSPTTSSPTSMSVPPSPTPTATQTRTPTAAATDTVAIQRADYTSWNDQLQVNATSTNPGATLQVFVTSTNQLIGTLNNNGNGSYSGTFSWPTNPQNITVRSNLGGSASRNVSTR